MTQKLINVNLGALRAQIEKTGQVARTTFEKSRQDFIAGARRTSHLAVNRLADLGTKASASQLAMFKELKRKSNVS